MSIGSQALIRRDVVTRRAPEAEILAFPTGAVRRRVARQQRVAIARRRVVVGSFLIVMVVGLLLGGGIVRSAPATGPSSPRTVTVRAGETMWDLARRFGPEGGDPRAYIHQIVELNSLEGAPQAGARLKLPR